MSAAAPGARLDIARPRRRLLLLAALPLAAVAAVGIGLVTGIRGANLLILTVAAATAVFSLLPLALDQGRPPSGRHLLLALFCLSFAARFVLPTLIRYLPETGPIDAPGMAFSLLRPWDVVQGQLVVLLALLSILLGYSIPVLRLLGPGFPVPRWDWPPNITVGVGLLMIAFGWVFVVARGVGLVPATLGSGLVSTLGSSLAYGNVLLALAYLRYSSRVAFLALCVTIPITTFLGFFTGAKTAALLVPAFVALTYMLERRRIPLILLLLGLMAIVVVYPANEYYRRVVLGGDPRYEVTAASRIADFVASHGVAEYLEDGFDLTAARLDGVGGVSVIVRDTPRVSPYQNGRTLVLGFVAFVPRVLWPDKPDISIGQFITDVYGSGPEIESSTGPTQIGDWYLNFGYAGVLFGMLLFGAMLRFSNDVLLRGPATAPAMLASVVVLFSFVLTFEGGVALAQANLVLTVIPIMLAHFLVRAVAPTVRRAAPASDEVDPLRPALP